MMHVKPHWTDKSTLDFMFRIRADFLAQVELRLESGPLSQKDLALRLGITEGAVSLMLNKPGDLKLQTMVKYARALGLKLSIVLYDDNDPNNHDGPIHSDIFRRCWEKIGSPKDFWAFEKQEIIPMFIDNDEKISDKERKYIQYDMHPAVSVSGGRY